VIDLHTHVLAGIDDGPKTLDRSLALARAAAAAGTDTLVATPHVSRHYPNDAATIARAAEELGVGVAAEGLDLEIRRGSEIAMTHAAELPATELERLRLGDGPWLMIEPSFTGPIDALESIVADLHRHGHRIVLAHPERCMAFHRDPLTLGSLVRQGALASITASSLVGGFGEHVRRFSLRLAEEGLVHNVASDTHDTTRRPPSIADELERGGLGELREWLTESVPAAILSGEAIPPRPPGATFRPPRKGATWLRRRVGRSLR
jgi:protein-tyrosine phosphatase